MRVLYVDDDRINTLLFVETCRVAGGFEVRSAASASEALLAVHDWAPDLLVIDLHLPDQSGYELLPALRSQLQAPDLPAYLCTADDERQVQTPARAAGFTGCWVKPVDLNIVLRVLAQLRGGLEDGPSASP